MRKSNCEKNNSNDKKEKQLEDKEVSSINKEIEENEKVNKTSTIEEKNRKSKKIRRRVVTIISLLAIIIGYIFARGNYLEISGIGENYLSVFKTDIIYTFITFIINFVILYLSFYLTNKTIKKGLKVFFDDEKKEMPKFPNKSVCFIIALIGSALSSRILLKNILLCFSGSKFGITDSVFGWDISFFVFIKPLIQFILIYLLAIVIATLVYAVIYAIIILNRSFDGVSRESLSKCDLISKIGSRVKIIAVLIGLIIIAFMVLNIGNEKFLNIELGDGTEYSLNGAGKAEINIKLAGYIIFAILATISILKAYKGLKAKSLRRVLGQVVIVPVYLIVLAVVLALYQLIFIGSNSLEKNQEFILANIEKTKQAYNITSETVSEKSIEYSGTITENEMNFNSDLLKNIAIVSKQNVTQDLSSSQNVNGYYTYRNTQIASYNVNGESRLVYLTPREISNQNATYSNMTYQYTHGYGSVVTLAGETEQNGNIIHYQKEINSDDEVIDINEPRIYFGTEVNSAIVINSKKTELDYPTETAKDVEYTYTGNAGLSLNLLDRIVLGIREGDMNLAFSGTVTGESKIITNRNILNRAKTIIPYLIYDQNPYMIIDSEGNQIWVIDAYTTTKDYPYAQKVDIGNGEEINYIRNSVKVLINAYDGSMKFYITDRTDPIIMAYNKMFPNVFLDEKEIPKDVREHFIYPQYLYDIQTKIIEKYHDATPESFYRANDVWEVTNIQNNGKIEKMSSYYTMTKDENGKQNVGLIIPFLTYGRQNINAYMIGTTENGQNKLKVCKFSSDSNVLTPMQLETQINQDDTIASELASLNVSGTRISKNLIAVPINNTILYVETYYQQYINETSQKPTLKRVVVASGNKVAIGNTLVEALENLSSKSAVNINVDTDENLEDLVKSIIKANENVKNSSKSNDWKLFGEDMQELSKLIDQMQNLVNNMDEQSTNEVTDSNNTID